MCVCVCVHYVCRECQCVRAQQIGGNWSQCDSLINVFYSFVVHLTALAQTVASDGMMINGRNKFFERSRSLLEILLRYFPVGTEENHEKPPSGWPVCGPRF